MIDQLLQDRPGMINIPEGLLSLCFCSHHHEASLQTKPPKARGMSQIANDEERQDSQGE